MNCFFRCDKLCISIMDRLIRGVVEVKYIVFSDVWFVCLYLLFKCGDFDLDF